MFHPFLQHCLQASSFQKSPLFWEQFLGWLQWKRKSYSVYRAVVTVHGIQMGWIKWKIPLVLEILGKQKCKKKTLVAAYTKSNSCSPHVQVLMQESAKYYIRAYKCRIVLSLLCYITESNILVFFMHELTGFSFLCLVVFLGDQESLH